MEFKTKTMKKLKKLPLKGFILFAGLCIYSCQDTIEQEITETEETTQTNTAEEIDFKGLKVNHRFSTPVEELFLEESTEEELTAKYNRIRRAVHLKNYRLSNGKTQQVTDVTDEELPTGEMIIEGIKMVVDQFPYDLDLSEDEGEDFEISSSPLTFKRLAYR